MAATPTRILITGVTGTIGNAIARALAKPAVRIALHYHSATERAELLRIDIEKSGAYASLIRTDLSKPGGASSLVAETVKSMGGLDLLVHCAAIFERTPLGDVTEELWNKIITINLKAAFFLAQSSAFAMKENGGRMIFISDVAAVKPYAGYLPYCVAKAGIDSLVRGLAKSLAPGILVNAIAPYIVTRPTGMSDEGWNDLLSKMPTRKAQTPGEIAALAKMLAETTSITGQVIAVDGGRILR